MPISPERMAELDAYYATKTAAPVVLSNKPDYLTQLAPDELSQSLTPERMAELDAFYASKQPPPTQDTFSSRLQADFQKRKEADSPSYLSRVGEAYKQGVKPAAALIAAPFIGEENRQYLRLNDILPPENPETFAKSVNQGPVGASAGVLGSMFAPVAPLVGDIASYAADKVGATPSQMENVQAAMNIAAPASMAGLGKSLGGTTVGDVANAVKKTIQSSKLVGDVTSGVSTNAALGGVPNAIPKKYTSQYDQMAGQKAMADTYKKNKATAGALYDDAKALATGKSINTQGLAQDVQGIIDDIQADPFHEARGALPKLQKTLDKLKSSIPETIGKSVDGEIPMQANQIMTKFDLADALDLKKTMNEAFNNTRWSQNAKGTV
jgi:hypothetical protein